MGKVWLDFKTKETRNTTGKPEPTLSPGSPAVAVRAVAVDVPERTIFTLMRSVRTRQNEANTGE